MNRKNLSKPERIRSIITGVVFTTLILSAVFILVRLIMAPDTLTGKQIADHVSTKADYVLMFLQCSLGIVAMLLPGWISKKWHLQIPSIMYLFYIIFLYCAIYLGEVRSFYYVVPHWDTILHTFSGFMLGCLSFSVISLMNNTERVPMNLTPAFVAMFAFCFAVMLGVVWEIYEYLMDGLWHMNMQKFMLSDGTLLVGHEALGDTMKDLMVDCLGAFVTSVVGYISLKFNKGWIEAFQLYKMKREQKRKD